MDYGVNKYLLCVLLLLVASCSSVPVPPIPSNETQIVGVATGAATGAILGTFSGVVSAPAGAIMGGIAGGAVGQYLAKHDNLSELNRAHLQLVRVGEEYMIYLPSDAYFYNNSTHINERFYPALNNIAQFLQQYETTSIKVAGYTDNIGNKTRNLALSRQQAQNIMDYLWQQGLNGRLIYSVGYGDGFPVARNDDEQGRAANRRVQITFRAIPPDDTNV